MSVPESETLRSSDPPVDRASLSLLPHPREEDKRELQEEEDDEYSESDEDDDPCENCGALMSFEFLYYPDTKTFVGTCTKCGGPSRSSS